MTYIKKRGAVIQLRRHGTSLVRGLLRDMKDLERQVKAEKSPTARQALLNKLIEYKIQLIGFIVPKPMAIASGVLDEEGSIISPVEARQLLEMARLQLEETNVQRQGVTEAKDIGESEALQTT